MRSAFMSDVTRILFQIESGAPSAAGWVRTFASFSAAINDVADARVFASIHFRTACEVGKNLGRNVAGYILENLMGRNHGEGE